MQLGLGYARYANIITNNLLIIYNSSLCEGCYEKIFITDTIFSSIQFPIFFAQVDINRNQTKLLTDTNKIGLVDLKSNPEIQRLNELKANLTTSQQKLSTDLLQLIRPEFLPKATSLEHHSETMKSLKQFKPFEQSANLEESISEGTVYVYVYLNQAYSTSIINSFLKL